MSGNALSALPGLGGIEQRLISLEYDIHLTEYRLRRDLLERDRACLDRVTSAMSLICRLLAEAMPTLPQRHHREVPMEIPGGLPIPDLDPRAITLAEYHALTPEKFELLEGYLFDTAAYPDARRRLLGLLLVNVGLLDVLRLAPEGGWREALRRVYGR
jgi:hypothetical protein